MSSKTTKSKKSTGPIVPDPLPPVTPVYSGLDLSNLPFSEWSDQEYNAEKWTVAKPKSGQKGKPKGPPTPSTPPEVPDEPSQFTDSHVIVLPASIPVHDWKRPAEVFPDANFIMYKEIAEYPDLANGSKHLLHSDFMRSFISAIGILEYLGNSKPSPIEFPTPSFVPNTNDIPWRPWHHIYSMCKAGKGQKHIPQVNALGKYYVRLFWMGCWRNITIDDLLPIDITKHVLLPKLHDPPPSIIESKVEKKSKSAKFDVKKVESTEKAVEEIEIWPFLLCKALLKLSSLAETDFDIIHSLTGWFVQRLKVEGLDVIDVWNMCIGYSDHYEWLNPGEKPGGSSRSKSDKKSKTSKSTKSSKDSKSTKVPNFLDENASQIIPCHLVATCSDMRTMIEDEVPDMSPCWSHNFLIAQTRNIPLIKPEPLPELATWKRFRWLEWAINKKIWPEPIVPIKCFKMVSNFKKFADHVVYKLPSKEAIEIKKAVAIVEDIALSANDKKGKKGKNDKPAKGGKNEKSSKSNKSKESGKSPKSKSSKGRPAIPLPADPSIWGDFKKLAPYVCELSIYFKSSSFDSNIHITDIRSSIGKDVGKSKPDKGKKAAKDVSGPKLLMWNNEILSSRNDPVYIFLDSLDYKLMVINLAQPGNIAVLEKNNMENIQITPRTSEELLHPTRSQRLYDIHRDNMIETNDRLGLTYTRRPFAYVIIENYNWQSNKVGETITSINTFGNKSAAIDLKPGRCLMKMWIKSDNQYFINLMSDTPVVAGTLEDVLERMSLEPERLQKLCDDVSSTYGQLVQQFGTANFSEALRAFYRSYTPDCKLQKVKLAHVHKVFMNEILEEIKENCPAAELRQRVFALKVLFVDPEIGRLECLIREEYADPIEQDVELIKERERAAVKIQAFFKKIFIRKLRAQHAESHKNYLIIFERLKKNYTEVFPVSRRMTGVSNLIRRFLLLNPEMENVKNYYSLLDDLNSTIHLDHFTGIVSASSYTWLPITRHVFYCNYPNTVLVKICLFCGFSHYIVRVFNNDTNKEIERCTKNTLVSSYECNALGYTVLCYGWSTTATEISWKLDFVTLKQKTKSLLIIPPVIINNHILKEFYKPNVNNLICKCLISISHDTLVTLRLSVTFEGVKIYFRCLNEVGEIFDEIYGTESVVLPAIQLKYVPLFETAIEEIPPLATSLSKSKRSRSKSRSGSLIGASANHSIKRWSRASDRMSSDRSSNKKSSVISVKKFKSTSLVQEPPKLKKTVYVLEGFVLDNSWPLTIDEWEVVEDVKMKNLLGGPKINEEEDLTKSTTLFKEMFKRRSTAMSARKSVDHKRKSSKVNISEQPMWCLETISVSDDPLVAIIDTRRAEEIKNIKQKWYENDFQRYERSKKIRETYLEHQITDISLEPCVTESIKMLKHDSSLTNAASRVHSDNYLHQLLELENDDQNPTVENDDHKVDNYSTTPEIEPLRTLKKPIPKTKVCPTMQFQYVLKANSLSKTKRESDNAEAEDEQGGEEEEDESIVRTNEEEEELRLARLQAIDDFEMQQLRYQDEMVEHLLEQKSRRAALNAFYKGVRVESDIMMKKAYESRQKVIDRIIEESLAKQPPTDNKKKGGKNKGAKKK